jgi:hypothetical protein
MLRLLGSLFVENFGYISKPGNGWILGKLASLEKARQSGLYSQSPDEVAEARGRSELKAAIESREFL